MMENMQWENENRLNAALSYQARKWSVIPVHTMRDGKCSCGILNCDRPGKHPRISWKDSMITAASEEQIRQWWAQWPDANVGIVTGKVSGITVVDIDGQEGLKSLIDSRIILPTTITVHTGGGGLHFYYATPEGGIKSSTGILTKVDIRGDGGFVVAPPSVHASGKQYQFREGNGLGIHMADFPANVRALLENGSHPEEPAKADTKSILHGVPQGQRDTELFRYAASLRGKGQSREEATVLVLHAAANCTPPFPKEQALEKVARVYENYASNDQKMKANQLGQKPTTFTAKQLEDMELPPTKWIIPELIPAGLTLLAGRAKSGKSFLALQLALSVALGEDICGFDKIREVVYDDEISLDSEVYIRGPKGVLYMDLEMDQLSIKQRMEKGIGKIWHAEMIKNESGGYTIIPNFIEAPENLHFAMEWPPIGLGFEEYLNSFLDEYPDTVMVVVDVYKRIKPREKGGRASAYDLDYEVMAPLQTLAKKRDIALVVCHHTRKKQMGNDSDAVEMVSGTMGLTAAVDNILVLDRKKDGTATLSIEGRKLRSRQIGLEHEHPSGVWTVLGEQDEVQMSSSRKDIIDTLRERGAPMKPKEIAYALSKTYENVKQLCWKMVKEGVLENNDGAYSLPNGQKAVSQAS